MIISTIAAESDENHFGVWMPHARARTDSRARDSIRSRHKTSLFQEDRTRNAIGDRTPERRLRGVPEQAADFNRRSAAGSWFSGDTVNSFSHRAAGRRMAHPRRLSSVHVGIASLRLHHRKRGRRLSNRPRTPARNADFYPKLPCHPVCQSRSAMPPGARPDAASSTRPAAAHPSGRIASRRQRSPRS